MDIQDMNEDSAKLFGIQPNKFKDIVIEAVTQILAHGMCDNCGQHPVVEKIIPHFKTWTKESFYSGDEKRFIYFFIGGLVRDEMLFYNLSEAIRCDLGEAYIRQEVYKIINS